MQGPSVRALAAPEQRDLSLQGPSAHTLAAPENRDLRLFGPAQPPEVLSHRLFIFRRNPSRRFSPDRRFPFGRISRSKLQLQLLHQVQHRQVFLLHDRLVGAPRQTLPQRIPQPPNRIQLLRRQRILRP